MFKLHAAGFYYNLLSQYRLLTWRLRPLPDVIILGAQKAGTTSLHYYLSQHPKIYSAYQREVHYFDGGLDPAIDNFKKGSEWYRSQFPIKRKSCELVFEKTPLYLFHPLAPKRIHELIPEAKLIAILRNPTERAISHYFHEKRNKNEELRIMEALRKEEERLAPIIEAEDYKNPAYRIYSYKRRGIYYEQIERYFNFFSQEQLLVLNSEELSVAPSTVLDRISGFIGMDIKTELKDQTQRNVSMNKTKVDNGVYEYLDTYFQGYNETLFGLIGRRFDWGR
jgi:hypothetical protein